MIAGKHSTAHVMMNALDEATHAQIQAFVDDPSFRRPCISIMPDCHAGATPCIGFTMLMNDRIIPDVVGVDIGCGMLARKIEADHLDVAAFDSFIKADIPSSFPIREEAWSGEGFFSPVARRIGMEEGRALRSVGTLGGGNHFIEAGFGTDARVWMTVHSGFRNFGLRIARRLRGKRGAQERGIPYLDVDSSEGRAYIDDQLIGSRTSASTAKR